MAYVTVGKWGRNLAIRFPSGIARLVGLNDGERLQIETRGDDIVIRRVDADAVADAKAAAEEIIDESCRYSLTQAEIRELIDEGRRG